MNTHLTDEQIAELLDAFPDQPAGAITQQHLLRCAHCQAEVAALRSSIANFRIATTNLAATEIPALSERRIVVPSSFRRNAWAASLATCAAMLAISVSLIHPSHPAQPDIAPPANVATVTDDDALLDGIQQDLSASIPPSLEPLAVPASQN